MAYLRGEFYAYSDGTNIYFHQESLPLEVFDALVVMRYAQLAKDRQRLVELEQATIRDAQGNVGCDALCRKYGQRTTLEIARAWMDRSESESYDLEEA